MSVAYFVVLNADDPGFDPFVDGKMFAKHLQRIDGAATALGLRSFENYAWQDLSEFGGPAMEEVWFEPGEGLTWAESLITHLRGNPDSIDDIDAVVEDLEGLRDRPFERPRNVA